MKVERCEREGVRFLEIDNGRVDYAYCPFQGWVSVNYDFIFEGEKNPVGIRWVVQSGELDKISTEDLEWASK
jgi:hypothetical protein